MNKNLSQIEEIKSKGLCIGCGFCESVCGRDAVEMKIQQNGFIQPEVKQIRKEKEDIIRRICPGINIINDLHFRKGENVWGRIEKIYSGYSNDIEIRTKGSSGGIISAIAVYALENCIADAVLQVGGDSNDYERNTLKVSRTKEDVLECASSRYAPALIFDKIFDILNSGDDTYCFIGKPCDISGLKNFLAAYPMYKNRFVITVSIMCAGMPSFVGTATLVNEFKPQLPIKELVYRGNGWPGFFSFTDNKGTTYKKTYNESWGKVLNRHLNLRCKLCPDGIGLQADIAVGDAWETKDGYPDFEEKEGHSLIIARTKTGQDLLQNALTDKSISFKDLPIEKLKLMQPYQFNRRRRVGARVLAFQIREGEILNYKHLKTFKNLLKVPIKTLLKEFIGTLSRLKK